MSNLFSNLLFIYFQIIISDLFFNLLIYPLIWSYINQSGI